MTLGTAFPRRDNTWGRFARFPSLFVLAVLVLGGLVIGVVAYAGDDGTNVLRRTLGPCRDGLPLNGHGPAALPWPGRSGAITR